MRWARVGLRRTSPGLGVLLRLRVLLDVSEPTRESVGEVRTLPRLGLGLADGSRLNRDS